MDEYQQYLDNQKKSNNSLTKIFRNVSPWHIGIVFILFLAGNWMVSTGSIKPAYFFGGMVMVLIAVVFLLMKQPNERKEIPEHIIKRIVYEKLEEKRRIGIEIPFDYTVRVSLVGESIYENNLVSGESGPIRRDVGFEIIKKGLKKKGVVGINPFTGNIGGIRWETLGYNGHSENSHRVIVPVIAFDKLNEQPNTRRAF